MVKRIGENVRSFVSSQWLAEARTLGMSYPIANRT